jgi:inorganic pyrophosphatase
MKASARMGSLLALPPSPAPGVIHVVIESPRGATAKIKYDERLDVFTLARPLPLGLFYPHDWGFVPGTLAEDGDPLDAMLLSEGTTFPGLVVRARPVAVLELEQDARRGGRERNDRLLAVPENAPRAVPELAPRVKAELERFFLDVTYFESKNARIVGWHGAQDALALVERAQAGRSRRAQRTG